MTVCWKTCYRTGCPIGICSSRYPNFLQISAKWEIFVDYNDFNADITVVLRIPYPEIPMSRLAITFGLLSLVLCSVGCRLCNTPHDYRITGYIDRCEDYRGFNPTYRAGSVLGGDQHETCQMVIGNAYYVGSTGDLFSNAGNYGVTMPVSFGGTSPGTFETPAPPRVEHQPIDHQTIDQRMIGVPQHDPTEQILVEPRRNGTGTVPSVEQLLQQPRGTMPDALPITPPARPRAAPPAWDDTPIDTIPFSPSDETIVPPSPNPPGLNPTNTHTAPGLQITLEELRRLDPSVHDVEIISIEDAGVGVPMQ